MIKFILRRLGENKEKNPLKVQGWIIYIFIFFSSIDAKYEFLNVEIGSFL